MANPVLRVDERVSLLKKAITANYAKGSGGVKPVLDAVEQVRQAGKAFPLELSTDIEVAFKDVLFEQISAALNKGVSLTDERHVHIRQLMDLALSVCIDGEVAVKAPVVLLEDFFEVLPLDDVNTMWAEVEIREAQIYKLFETFELSRIREAAKKAEGGDDLDASGASAMPGAKGAKKPEVATKALPMTASNTVRLTMLKTCNALLRKLSKVQNTKVCGRVMLYLARNWALSDTSALNKAGATNVNNKTNFETADEFKANHSSQRGGGDAMETDAEASRRRNLDEEAEAEMQRILNLSSELHAKAEEGAERAPEPEPLEFQLYQTFWGLQGYLSTPKAFFDAKTPERWAEFVQGAKTVLEAFEGMVVSEEAAQQMLEEKRKAPSTTSTTGAKRRRTTMGGAGGVRRGSSGGSNQGAEEREDDAYVGCKYLTNSRLFRLQLRDPLIRVQVLTQMATVLQYIDLHSRTLGQAVPTGHPELAKHVRRLIRSTPPLGAQYLALLDSTLEREEWWVNWKAGGCVGEVEKDSASRAPRGYKLEARYTEALKRFQETQCFKGATALLRGFWSESAPLPAPLALEKVEELLQCNSHSWDNDVDKAVQESEKFIEEYGPSYDEEGYLEHPCRNPVFNWRALRLAKRTHPQAFALLDTGDLNMLWKKVHGKPTMFINAKMRPEAAVPMEEEEEEMGQPAGEGAGEGAEEEAPTGMEVDEGWGEEEPPKGSEVKAEA